MTHATRAFDPLPTPPHPLAPRTLQHFSSSTRTTSRAQKSGGQRATASCVVALSINLGMSACSHAPVAERVFRWSVGAAQGGCGAVRMQAILGLQSPR